MSRVLVVSHDVVGERMAGPAIRAVELSRVLAGCHDVTLAVPNDCSLDTGLRSVRYRPSELESLAVGQDVVLVGGLTLALCPALADTGVPLVVDIYDPFTLENLQLFSGREMPTRLQDSEGLLNALLLQLRRGDFYLCASEKQRDFWLGMLHAAGRLNPYTYDHDRSLRKLVDVVPFGVPEEAPVAREPALKGRHPGIGSDDLVVLWGGGIYDWFDPLTAIRAVSLASEREPRLKLFFMGVRHPNPAVHRMGMVDEAVRLAHSLGLTDKSVFFNDWVPYARRADYLLDADIGISLHLDHLETAYSFRTRILDYLWAGLPIVATSGDSLATAIEQRGMGIVVPPEDPQSVAEALLQMVDARARQEMGGRAREMALKLTWRRCAEPLLAFCDRPAVAADRRVGYSPGRTGPDDRRDAGFGPVRKVWASLRQGGPAQLVRDIRAYISWRLGR
ncbi:MAG: glycosyltransferase [Anaerolineae bacterium]|nr:glycosyltransferase [Anaerolineae bacterium]